MNYPYTLKPHLCRVSKHFEINAPEVPAELASVKNEIPDLKKFPYPLPSKKSDYTCALIINGIEWYGATTGLTRVDRNAERDEDKVMYFSADRDLCDNCVKALLADGEAVWVLTETAVTRIEMKLVTAEEKAYILLDETLNCVMRRGMVSQRYLRKPRDFESRYPYTSSDNDGTFTADFAFGEVFRYATLKREKGIDHPDTIDAKKVATKAVEACLLLMHIPCRGDGFVARSYHCTGEPVPDDGMFFKICDGKATAVETTDSNERGDAGRVIDASAPVPERLAKLYTDLGFTINDITYKADTSSDEITNHFLLMLVAHDYLTCDDAELDDLIKSTLKGLLSHIIDHGYEFHDYTGRATTWAKWSPEYFNTEAGYVDATLNAAELLMYHLVIMHVTGEEGRWLESYNHLINDLGYADLTEKHFDRLYQMSLSMEFDYFEDIMYGDHMLALASYWGLCTLEKDEELLAKYKRGFKAWRTSLEREHNAGYDLLYQNACPEDEVDFEAIATWFYRMNLSRLAAGVTVVGRHDVPVKTLRAGTEEISVLLPQDERFISKYDRNPFDNKNEDSGGVMCIESCYIYTFAYWFGRYFGYIN